MQSSKNNVMKPIEERLRLCPYCYEKLGFVQSVKGKVNSQVRCSKCGKMIRKNNSRTY